MNAKRQRGVVAIEFALVFLLGMLPLLLLTFSGVLIFAAKQSLTLAAANGARAALRYAASDTDRATAACQAARQSMQWLLNFSQSTTPCAAVGEASTPIAVVQADCPTGGVTCITVKTSFDYNEHPFLPGTQTVYHWAMKGAMNSSATVQLADQITPTP